MNNKEKIKEFMISISNPMPSSYIKYVDIYHDNISANLPVCGELNYKSIIIICSNKSTKKFELAINCNCKCFANFTNPDDVRYMPCTRYKYLIDGSNINILKKIRMVEIDFIKKFYIECIYNYINQDISIKINAPSGLNVPYENFYSNGTEEEYNLIFEKYKKLYNIL